ncbi:MAG: hypothetical protein KF773_15920 [Deltaproteobacteria bacterium]|nr:hypothetical protein [Deltaproteobacteria bacterium]
MRRAVCAAAAVLAACGDGIVVEPVDEAVSGARLMVEWVFYGDGSRQPAPQAFYDTELHARCQPGTWVDGTRRCIPVADPAIYTRPDCTVPIGVGLTNQHPDLFIGYEIEFGVARPKRIYRALAPVAQPEAAYQLSDGECFGVGATPPGIPYFALAPGFDGNRMAVIDERDDGADGERLAQVVVESSDGLRVPIGFRDREAGALCEPEQRASGTVCAPRAAPSDIYLDPSCREPGIALFDGPQPSVVSHPGPDGCRLDYRVGPVVEGAFYRRNGAVCELVPFDGFVRGYRLGAPVEPIRLEREVDDATGRRLQRVTLASGSVRARSDRMFDTATRDECRPVAFGDVLRCLPARAAHATYLLGPGCGVSVLVAEMRAPACAPVAFAMSSADGFPEIRAIGDPAGPLFDAFGAAGCVPHVPPADHVVYDLGPPIPPETFTGGRIAGER